MNNKINLAVIQVMVVAAGCGFNSAAQAGFAEDSQATLELRNMYLNRDYRQNGAPVSHGEVWAQGFIGRFKSGYTQGVVGFGLDAMALAGVRLDSGKGRVNGASGGGGIGMLPLASNGKPVGSYGKAGLTLKAKLSNSRLQLGTLQPSLPVVMHNDTRLLPGSYTGGMLTMQELKGLTVHAGRLSEYSLRDQSHREKFARKTDYFDVLGGTYALNDSLTASYYHGHLENAYKQHFIGLVHQKKLNDRVSLRTDLRYFVTDDSGRKERGRIDNRFFNGMLSLGVDHHRFSAAYQNLSGDNDFQVINGADPYNVNLSTYWTFWREEEDAWQARYDYNFAGLGLPGLSLMTRYISAYNVKSKTGNKGKEWERDTDLVYSFQNTSLKGLRVHLRNVTYRSGRVAGAPDVDENRVILSYTLTLL